MKTNGDDRWRSFPSYLDVAVPRIMACLRKRGLTSTVFVVGKDATIEHHRDLLRSIAEAGHEIANHSFLHEPWLGLYSVEDLRAELASTEEWLERVTGQVPVGFRAPAFGISESVARELVRRGYLYDASTFPTVLGPLARRYFLSRIGDLGPEELRKRQYLYGTVWDGFKPLMPYRWRVAGKDLIEIPVTTLPALRVPFHVSYIMYLSMVSTRLALAYFRTALRLCRLSGITPSILLHPLDFLGSEDIAERFFFPAMGLPRERKLAVVNRVLDIVAQQFVTMPLREHAERLATLPGLRVVESRPEHDS
jgi:peptidoglycan/xylan/chitin deacetylase (PgdA/CDA1 family)